MPELPEVEAARKRLATCALSLLPWPSPPPRASRRLRLTGTPADSLPSCSIATGKRIKSVTTNEDSIVFSGTTHTHFVRSLSPARDPSS